LRILLVTSEFPPGPGGIGHHAWFLAKELSCKVEIHIDVLCPKDYATEYEVLKFDLQSPVRIFRWNRVKGFTYLLRIYDFIKLLRGNRYTHFWASGKFPLWLIWVQRVFSSGSKSLCILHGSEVNLANFWLKKFTHLSISKFETIVSVSRFTQTLLPNWIIQSHNKLKVIPNGLDLSDFTLPGQGALLGSPSLLTVGHVSPRKGQHRLIKALPSIIEQFPNVHYHIVGRPIDQLKLELLATNLGVEQYVTFHGSVKSHADLWDYYNASDVFVLLSENQGNGDVEGFGIVALEANACGKPVLGAKFCGVEEAVAHLDSGFLVDGDDDEEICHGIKYCFENKESLNSTSRLWADRHAWSKVSKEFELCL